MTQKNIREKENPLPRLLVAVGRMTARTHLALGWPPHLSSCPCAHFLIPGETPRSQRSVWGSAHRVATWLVPWGCLGGPGYKRTVSFLLVLAELSPELHFRQYRVPDPRGPPRTPASCLCGTNGVSASSLGLLEALGLEGGGEGPPGAWSAVIPLPGSRAPGQFWGWRFSSRGDRDRGKGPALLPTACLLSPHPGPAPQRAGTEAQGKVWGAWAGQWGRGEGPGVGGEHPPGVSSASPMTAETH